VPQDASGLEFFPKRYVLRPKLIRLCLTILDPIDNSLPSIADFPAFRDIGTHSPQEVFYLCFRDLFQYNPALQDTPSLEKLDELYIESLGRYFGKQACVAKAALLKAPTGLNIFIKTNTVLISEAFLGSDVAKMKPYVQILRAFSSMHAFNILKNVVSPDTLRSAKLEHLIKIIVLLALCTEQTLDLIERREQPGSDWSDAERKLQDFIATEMVHHLRYLILTVFTSSSRLLRFVDSRDHQRLLANTFWKDFRDDTIQLVLWPGAGPPPRRQNSKKDVSRRSLALINAADGPWTLTEGSAASESPGNTSSRLTGEQSQIETPRPSHGSFKDILHHSWALEETVAADPLNYKPGVSSKLWTHHWVLQEAVVAGRLRYIPDISSALWDGTAELVTSITSNPTSQPVPQLLLTDPSLDSFSNFGADYESFNLDFPVLEMPDVQGNFDFDIFLNQSGDADFSAGIFDSNSVPDAMKMAEVLGSANKPNTTL
jgi:hypothetical protein